MANILKILYNTDKRELKKFEKYATKVEEHADEMSKLSDEQLQAKTIFCQKHLQLLVKVQSVY